MIRFARLEGLGRDTAQLDSPAIACTWDYWPFDYLTATLSAHCACPNGHLATVAKKIHTIAGDGTLSPSYVCPRAGCDFHDYVRFEGWSA